MIKSRLVHNLVSYRCICTSPRLNFKIRWTDELVKEAEEMKKARIKPPPPQALHTQKGSLIMARVSSERYNKVIKVGVPKHRLNESLLFYIREQDSIQAYDENEECEPGDWILLRRQKEPIDTGVEHKVERIVHKYGKYIDPITGRRAFGLYFDDDLERLEKIKLDK